MKIAFVGDLTVDRYPELGKIYLGGSSLNGAMWANKAGIGDISVFAAVGDDANGKLFIAKLQKEKIDATGVRVARGTTSSIEIFIDQKTGAHHWGEWHPGVLNSYHLTGRDFKQFPSFDALSLVVYGPTKHLVSEFASWREKRKTRPFLIVNFDDLSQFDRSIDVVKDYIEGIDAGFFGLDCNTDRARIEELRKLACDTGKLMVITLGRQGAIAFDGKERYESPAVLVESKKIQDTTGAGDAFLAGFMVEYLKTNGDIQLSLVAGNYFGAQKIQIQGAY